MSSKIDNEHYEDLGPRWYEAYDHPVALLRAESRAKSKWISEQLAQNGFGLRSRVLDVGCGAGFLTNHLAGEGFEVTGIDCSASSLAEAARRDPTGQVRYLQADAYALPFADQSFDVVAALDFLEHVERPAEAIAEMARVLRPGGCLFFHTFSRNWLAGLVVICLVEWFIANTPKRMHLYKMFIKPSELQKMCADCGLVVTKQVGLKPRWRLRELGQILRSGEVPKGFSFELSSKLWISYLGFAIKPLEPSKKTLLSI